MAATVDQDYYEILGVPPDADAEAIKDAFRQLALKYHPDRNKQPGAEERFKQIAEAYAVLSDPRKRADYDARGHAAVAGFSPEDLFGGIDFSDVFGGFDFGLGEGLFERFFGHHPGGPVKGSNVEVEIDVPLERVATGGEQTVRYHRTVTCPTCGGSGAAPGTEPKPCSACGGTGQKSTVSHKGKVTLRQITTCPDCRGRGATVDKPCPDCAGRGQVERVEELGIAIPRGIEEGVALRVPGHGLPATESGGEPGDLFVVVRTAPDRRFQRRGADLWRTETLGVADAALGTRLEVPTLDGPVTVKVPPGTQPEEVLRVRGKGLPTFGGDRRGNLYVRIQVHVPERLSPELRALLEDLRKLENP